MSRENIANDMMNSAFRSLRMIDDVVGNIKIDVNKFDRVAVVSLEGSAQIVEIGNYVHDLECFFEDVWRQIQKQPVFFSYENRAGTRVIISSEEYIYEILQYCKNIIDEIQSKLDLIDAMANDRYKIHFRGEIIQRIIENFRTDIRKMSRLNAIQHNYKSFQELKKAFESHARVQTTETIGKVIANQKATRQKVGGSPAVLMLTLIITGQILVKKIL